ncbi:MAG TPA: FtsX-like permease family protein [Acidimicrobiales bacterium]
MIKLTLKNLMAHKRRLASTFLAVVIGVAFLSGNLVLTDTITKTFDDLFANVNQGTDAVVRSSNKVTDNFGNDQRGRIPTSLLPTVQAADGVKTAEPQVIGYGQIVGKDGKTLGNPGRGAPTFAGNWSTVPELNPFRLQPGSKPPTGGTDIVIDKKSADDGHLAVGDRTAVITAAGPNDFTITGIAKFGDQDSPAGASFALMTLPAAEKFVSKPGEVDSIDVVAQSGVSQEQVVQNIQKVLPQDTEAITGAQLTKENQDNVQKGLSMFFNILLKPFAVIAILVSVFSIYNTFSIIVAQRTREMALLRALGAARRQVMSSVVFEAFIIGLVAAVVGLFGGFLVAGLLKAILAAFGLDIPAGGLVLKAATVEWAFAVGVGVSVLTSIIPALKASRVPPLAAMRDVAVERTHPSLARVISGGVAAALGLLAIIAGVAVKGSTGLGRVGIGALLMIVALVVLGPALAGPISRTIGSPLPRFRGVAGKLARENATRNPRRTSGAASALMIGVAVVALFTVFASSIKASIDNQIKTSFAGDLVIDSQTRGFGGFNPQLTGDVSRLPQVAAASGIRTGQANVNGSDRQLVVVDPSTIQRVLDLGIEQGSLQDLNAGTTAVATRYADATHLKIGDEVKANYLDGASSTLKIVATYKNRDVLGSDFMLPLSEWEPHSNDNLDSLIIVKLNSGVSIADGRAAVETVAKPYPNAKVQDRQTYTDQVFGMVNQILSLVYVLLAFAILIALMGIANTLSLSIFERTRELGLLRAVGETRSQLRSMVRWESVIVALFGTLGGVALGTLCGWALVETASESGFARFALPLFSLIVLLVLGALAGVVAGIRPARRAARLDVLRAIATE